MLIKSVKNRRYKRPKRGECGAVFTMARDGHWYCLRKRAQVDVAACAKCDMRDRPGCGDLE